jgi:hypothetical protein
LLIGGGDLHRILARWNIFMLWLLVVFVFCFLNLIVAPARGAAWIQDDGLFLLMSWNAANGFGLDKLLPQSPQYLFHALLMKAGMLEYLHFRYVNYFLILTSSMVFFLGLVSQRFKSPWVPISICASLLVSANSIENPNALAMAFFLFGAGCYFFAAERLRFKDQILLVSSGLFFAVAGFMHAAVVIAMLVLIAFIWFVDSSIRKSLLLPTFLVFSILLWGGYIFLLGLENLFVAPVGHDASTGYIFNRILKILTFYTKALLLYFLALWWFRKHIHNIHYRAQSTLSILVTIFCSVSLVTYLAESNFHFPGWLWVSQIPGAVFLLIFFVFFRWFGECALSPVESELAASQKEGRLANFKGRLQKYFVTISRVISVLRVDVVSRRMIISMFGMLLIQSAVAVGSNTAIIQGMVAFAGPTLGLTIIMWDDLDKRKEISTQRLKLVAIFWLGILGIISLTFNHPTGQPVLAAGRVVLENSPLKGISEQPLYAKAVSQLRDAYQANGCEKLTMVSFDYIPLVFYILQHPASDYVNITRPSMFFPEERIKMLLSQSNGWCILDITGIETQDEIDRNRGVDKRAALRKWVEDQSNKIVTIPAPSSELVSEVRIIIKGMK